MNETNMTHRQDYAALADVHLSAFDAFRRIYERRQPPPVSGRVERGEWLPTVVMLALLTAGMIVSGSRTIVEFGGGLVGLSAFVMLECAIVSFAFTRTRNHFDDRRMGDVRRLTNTGLRLAFLVAVAANVHATLRQGGVQLADGLNTLILLLVAVSAPTLAYITGDMLAVEYVKVASKRRKVNEAYAELMAEWSDGLNRAWQREQGRWGVRIEVDTPGRTDSPQLSALSATDRQRTDSGQHGHGVGYNRTTDARTRVREYLSTNPDAATWPVRQLADAVGVGKTVAAEVVREMRAHDGTRE